MGLAMATAYFIWGAGEAGASNSNGNPAGSTPPEPAATPVRTTVLEPRTLARTLRLTGTLRADESVSLRSEIAARVVEIYFDEGEPVETGDLLVKLDDAELRAELGETEADLTFARREEGRQKRLFEEGNTSERLYDEAANRRSLLEARLRILETRLEKTEIRAPFSGTIGLREISPGSFVQSDTLLASLRRLDPLKIDFSAPERYVGDLRTGMEFQIEVPGSDGRYEGVVYAREPGIDPETRTVRMRGRIANPGDNLLPGGYAQVFLDLGGSENVLMIPTVAVVPGQESSVFVVENGVVHRRPVELGRRARDGVQILSGVESGETVVVAGMQNIRPGQRVRVLNDNMETNRDR